MATATGSLPELDSPYPLSRAQVETFQRDGHPIGTLAGTDLD